MDDSKQALLSARVGKRLRQLELGSYQDYLSYLRKDTSGKEMVEFLNVISTNVTSFFREMAHFDLLREQIQQWLKGGQRHFRLWSAASSTGEEPYSMAMVLLETLAGHDYDAKILATDLDTGSLRKCLNGLYWEDQVRPVPRFFKTKYFLKRNNKQENSVYYEVKSHVRDMVAFRHLNLSKPPFPMKGPLDIVFCRNVMIYFDWKTRHDLTMEIHRLLKPGGLLMVGHSETLNGLNTPFKSIKPAVYQKTL